MKYVGEYLLPESYKGIKMMEKEKRTIINTDKLEYICGEDQIII